VAFAFAEELEIEICVFEATDPEVFEWYIKNFGPAVNLFVSNRGELHPGPFDRVTHGYPRTK